MTPRRRLVAVSLVLASWAAPLLAHSGPPYPAVSGVTAGAYTVTVWTDPDTTDDETAAGKFWITLEPAKGRPAPGAATRVEVSIEPTDRPGAARSARAELVKSGPATFYAAVRMDHEGPFAVHVTIEDGAGRGELDCAVAATYDLRPSRWLLILYVLPFALVALLWGKLLVARRRRARDVSP